MGNFRGINNRWYNWNNPPRPTKVGSGVSERTVSVCARVAVSVYVHVWQCVGAVEGGNQCMCTCDGLWVLWREGISVCACVRGGAWCCGGRESVYVHV